MRTLTTFFLLLLMAVDGWAGTVTGQIQTATGAAVPNGTLTFSLSQAATVAGTATVVTTPVNCFTDGSGVVVGEPNPLVAPVVSTNTASGAVAAGTYYTRITYWDASGETVASPETATLLSATGTLIVSVPVKQPATASGWKIYMGGAPGAETLQSTQTGFGGNYSQSSSLAAGAAMPNSNTTACKLRFNDELTPSFTAYVVSLTNSSGSTIAGFPAKWYLSGGASGTVNLSQGTPLYAGTVQYPQAIVALPAANSLQSVNGPLSLNGFGLTSTSIQNDTFNGMSAGTDITDAQFGAKCDGSTDDTSALATAIAAVCGTGKPGGTILVPAKTCKIAGQITFPNDGGSPPKQVTCKIKGAGSGGLLQGNSYLGTCNKGGSVLNLTFNAPVAKILTLGLGRLEMEDLCLQDSGTDSAPFLLTTNTQLYVHNVQVEGSHTGLNDAFILGGTNACCTADGTTGSMFQGYGTVIRDSQADYVKRFALLQNEANAVIVADNHIFDHSANATGGLIELNPGANPATQGLFGTVIRGNLCEMGGSKYCVNIVQNVFSSLMDGNQCFDNAGPATNCVKEQASAGNSGNTVIDLNPTGAIPSSVTTASALWTNGKMVLPAGSAAAAPLTFGNKAGIYLFGGAIGVATSLGNSSIIFNGSVAGEVHLPNNGTLSFDSTTNPESNTPDTALSRCSAGTLCAGNGTPGDFSGTYKAASLKQTASATPLEFNRTRADQGNALVAGDFGTLTGWGSTASIAGVGGTDAAGFVQISCSGTGQTANPSLIFTYHDGSAGFGSSPIPTCTRQDTSPGNAAPVCQTGTTQMTIILQGMTCTAGNTYTIYFTLTGRK